MTRISLARPSAVRPSTFLCRLENEGGAGGDGAERRRQLLLGLRPSEVDQDWEEGEQRDRQQLALPKKDSTVFGML